MLLFYIDQFDAIERFVPHCASVLPALLFATHYSGDVVSPPSRVPLLVDAPSWQAHLLFDAISPQLCCAALVDPRTPLAQLPTLLDSESLFAANQALRIADTCLHHDACWALLCDPPAQSRCPAALSALALAHACGCVGDTASSLKALRLLAGPGKCVEMCVAAGLGGCAPADAERRCGAARCAPWAAWPGDDEAGMPRSFVSHFDGTSARAQTDWRDAVRGVLPPRGGGFCPAGALWLLVAVAEQLTPEAAVRRLVNRIVRNVVARSGDGAAPPPSLATLCARALGASVDFSVCGLWDDARARAFARAQHDAAVSRGESLHSPMQWLNEEAYNARPPPRPAAARWSLLELFDVACGSCTCARRTRRSPHPPPPHTPPSAPGRASTV